MKIEVLFSEHCNLYGDSFNMKYLEQCLPDAEFIETPLSGRPAFADKDVDLIYLGPMPERVQERVIEKLSPYKERLRELIGRDVTFLFTGNALEVMGDYIENEDGSRIPALGIFRTHAKRDMMHRHNSIFSGVYEDITILGFKTQFSMSYSEDESLGFIRREKGVGLNKKCGYEGIHYKNFFGTYLIGPLLVMNPLFMKKLLRQMGAEPSLAYEDNVLSAYRVRLQDYENKVGKGGNAH